MISSIPKDASSEIPFEVAEDNVPDCPLAESEAVVENSPKAHVEMEE